MEQRPESGSCLGAGYLDVEKTVVGLLLVRRAVSAFTLAWHTWMRASTAATRSFSCETLCARRLNTSPTTASSWDSALSTSLATNCGCRSPYTRSTAYTCDVCIVRARGVR